MERPRRRHDLQIHIGGDTWEDVIAGLDELLDGIHGLRDRHGAGECTSLISAGGSCSYSVTGTEDPSMTQERYHAAVRTWLDAKRDGAAPAGDHP